MAPHSTASKILAEVHDLATVAAAKLETEASQREHCLRRMVLTANLVDGMTVQTLSSFAHAC